MEQTQGTRESRINELRFKKHRTDKEQKELERISYLQGVDPDMVRREGEKAQRAQDAVINREYYLSGKFMKNTLSTGLCEGAKMGFQQAMGMVLLEVFSSSFFEIEQAFKKGLEGQSLFDYIKLKLSAIGKKVVSKWKDVFDAGAQGVFSGFISNIVTVIVNAFITTGRRIVRLIREGVFSLLRALKMVLFPPEGMTFKEAMHEAMKLIASGGIIVAGIALEEMIEKMVMGIPLLAPIASLLSPAIVGSIAAIGIALTSYLINKMDLLGIVRIEQDRWIIGKLDQDIKKGIAECDRILEEMDILLEGPGFALT